MPKPVETFGLAEIAVRFEIVSNTTWSNDNGDAELRDEDYASEVLHTYSEGLQTTLVLLLVRTRYYTINSDKKAYYYSLILCHITFRNEVELLLKNETAEDYFARYQSELRPLQGNVSAEQFSYELAITQATALSAAHETDVGNALMLCVGEHFVHDDDNFCKGMKERAVISDELFLGSIRGLNVQQRDLFQKVSTVIKNDLQRQESQLLHFITGGAGSGK